jgi:hypothetical protein
MYFPIAVPLVVSSAKLYMPQKIMESQKSLENLVNPFLSTLPGGADFRLPTFDSKWETWLNALFIRDSFVGDIIKGILRF